MTDSRDRGISQSAFENPGPYIPIRTAHTDRLIRTASHGLPHTDRHFITTKLLECTVLMFLLKIKLSKKA